MPPHPKIELRSMKTINAKAAAIKKKAAHVPMFEVKHDLAVYLGFSNWRHLTEASETTRARALVQTPIGEL